jgi:hypothetical protein
MVLKFPKHEKFLLANKIREFGYDIFELAVICNKKVYKKTTVTDLNVKHEVLRQLINLAFELKYIGLQKHKTASLLVDEVGKMIGAWVSSIAGNA